MLRASSPYFPTVRRQSQLHLAGRRTSQNFKCSWSGQTAENQLVMETWCVTIWPPYTEAGSECGQHDVVREMPLSSNLCHEGVDQDSEVKQNPCRFTGLGLSVIKQWSQNQQLSTASLGTKQGLNAKVGVRVAPNDSCSHTISRLADETFYFQKAFIGHTMKLPFNCVVSCSWIYFHEPSPSLTTWNSHCCEIGPCFACMAHPWCFIPWKLTLEIVGLKPLCVYVWFWTI